MTEVHEDLQGHDKNKLISPLAHGQKVLLQFEDKHGGFSIVLKFGCNNTCKRSM